LILSTASLNLTLRGVCWYIDHSFSFFLLNEKTNDERIDKQSENQKAGQKPFTLKPCTNLLSIKIIIVLITRRKIPSVRMVIGSVRIIRMGFTIKSRILNTNATNIAVPYVLMETPGIKFASI
jgi:hypothetical protein